jgi:hypothetical protein
VKAFQIEARGEYLRIEIVERETPEEARAIGEAIVSELERTGLKKLLIVERGSEPIFRVERYGLSKFIGRAAAIGGIQAALVAYSKELHGSHQYVEVLARQRGIDVRSFRDEHAALAWLDC